MPKLNTYLDVLKSKAYDIRTDLIDRGKLVTVIEIKTALSGEMGRNWMLLALFQKHNDELEEHILVHAG